MQKEEPTVSIQVNDIILTAPTRWLTKRLQERLKVELLKLVEQSEPGDEEQASEWP